MHSFVRNLITEWRKLKLAFAGETVVVGVSGGADSVSLLLALNELKKLGKLDLRIVAAHFNHKLRGDESEADEEFVRHLTAENGIELATGKARLLKGGNIEQNARDARYGFLRSTAENVKAFAVATAHTVNDQAETFLLNLVRGSGPEGLSGMKPVRVLEEESTSDSGDVYAPLLPFSSSPILLVRPLLNWARRLDTEGYCRSLQVEYRYDTMNEDEIFKRVRIRKVLIPLLEDFNPKIVETLANTARLMQMNGVPERPAKGSIPKTDDEILLLKDLKSLSKPDLYSALRRWLKGRRGNLRLLELKHTEAIERLIHSRKSGKMVELPQGQMVVKERGRLIFTNIMVEKGRSEH